VAKHIGADRKRETKTLAQALGAEVTSLRLSKRWSQQKLADFIGYDVTHVRQTELGGNPTLELLAALGSALSLEVSELIRAAEERVRRSRGENV
jgi:transcriptional regulator with XRE-family HTH domain